MKRLQRLVMIAFYLASRRRVLARHIADEFEISLRTVYRDVKALQDAGFPVEGTAGDGYRVTQDAFLRPLQLTSDEAEALVLAARALGPTFDAPLRLALTGALTKLESTLDRPAQRRIQAVLGRTLFPGFTKRRPALTSVVLAAVRDRHVLRISYKDTRDGARTERDIEPLGFVSVGDAFWLLAYCRLRTDARIFRVDQIEACTPTGAAFEVRPGFSFAEIIKRDDEVGRRLFGS